MGYHSVDVSPAVKDSCEQDEKTSEPLSSDVLGLLICGEISKLLRG